MQFTCFGKLPSNKQSINGTCNEAFLQFFFKKNEILNFSCVMVIIIEKVCIFENKVKEFLLTE
jgi:hypothetical protein